MEDKQKMLSLNLFNGIIEVENLFGRVIWDYKNLGSDGI